MGDSRFWLFKGKKVAVKKAQAKQGKIYVGKLKAELSDEEIKSHFAQFGQIAQVWMIYHYLMTWASVSGRAAIRQN